MINIRDYMRIEEDDIVTVPSLVMDTPDKRSALDRREALDRVYAELQSVVNGSDRANLPADWHAKYAALTGAIIDCARVEERILE